LRPEGILAHRYADGTLRTYVALNKSEKWISRIDFSDPASVVTRTAAEFDGWPPAITALITDSETDPLLRSIYALPIDHKWDRVAGVTLVGDAAHLMSPFAGEGADLAMLDGAELGEAIARNSDNLETALKVYEKELFPRSNRVAEETARNLELFFGETAPRRDQQARLATHFAAQLRYPSARAESRCSRRPGVARSREA
jgi:2-polyprenyl-6-methoxyphenol hydroxylase-like FAD-dependent oxidoreductase